MKTPLTITPRWEVPAEDLSWRFSRSGGPGGQGVNTTDSRVELVWEATGLAVLSETLQARALERLSSRLVNGQIVIAASEYRSQRRNRQAARERLAALLREAIAPPAPPRRPTKPSKAARQRRLDGKKQRGQVKRLRTHPFD